MNTLKGQYEISIWEDVIKYVGVNGNIYDSLEELAQAGTTVNYQFYSEQRLAVIGSDTMTSLARAINPVLSRNINGVYTLKFDMYYQFVDNETGKIERNPLIDLVIDERKVKLYYPDGGDDQPDHWYDFIVKKDDEKGRENKYSFTCNGLAANELGKTGFNVELDTELKNNMGTVQELGAAVLEDSDWQLAQSGQQVIQQTNDEALYSVILTSEITDAMTLDGEDFTNIPVGARIYVYYTPWANQEKDYFQFIYVNGDTGTLTPDLYEDKVTIYCNNTRTYDLYLTGVDWENDQPSFATGAPNVSLYRGRRYVRKQLMAYDPVLEKTVYKYNKRNETPAVVYHGYTTTEYISAASVVNFIHNSVNFPNTTYWNLFNGGSLSTRIYPDAKASNLTESRKAYLIANLTSSSSYLYNDGIIHNYTKIDRFEIGLKYRLKIKVATLNDSNLTYLETLPFDCKIEKYELIDSPSNRTTYFTFSGAGTYSSENDFITIDAECTNSATLRDLKENVGVFFTLSTNGVAETDYYIEEIRLFKYIEDENGEVLDIDSVPEPQVNTIYHFYNPAINAGFLSTEDYIFDDNDPDEYIALYGSGDKEFEKVRSITAKESNRFNLLQQLAETFQCWVKFHIDHEEDGSIKVVDYNYYTPVTDIESGFKVYENGGASFVQGLKFSTTLIDSSIVISSKNLIKVTPGITYNVKIDSTYQYKFLLYDNNKEYITSSRWTMQNSFTVRDNTYYIIFEVARGNVKDLAPSDLKLLEIYPQIENGKIYDQLTKSYIDIDRYSPIYYIQSIRKRQKKEVIFYGEILQDNYIGFKYGINLKDNNRTLDSEQIATKIIVKNNSCEQADNGFCSIARAKDNPIKENFALNLDYYTTQGLIDANMLNNDLYLKINGSIGLYPRLSELNKERNDLIAERAVSANVIDNLKSQQQVYQLQYNESAKDLEELLDPVSGKLVRYTGYVYDDFGNQYNRYAQVNVTESEFNANKTRYYYYDKEEEEYIQCDDNSVYDSNKIYYRKNPVYANTIYYIKASGISNIVADAGTITYYKRETASTPQQGRTYYKMSGNQFVLYESNKFIGGFSYYYSVSAQYDAGVYFQTDTNTTFLTFTGSDTPEVYIYDAARRTMNVDDNDFTDDSYTIAMLASVSTLTAANEEAYNEYTKYTENLESAQAEYDSIEEKLTSIATATKEVEKEFYTKYSRYIQEGSWIDDNYMDDDLYYLDALSVLYQSAYPKVTYNFTPLDLRYIEGYEDFDFQIAHKTYVEDVEMFGYRIVNNLRTPVRETVVVTELTQNLDDPTKNQIKIQNYKSHFEDLFQRITAATQSLEYHSGEYAKAAGAMTTEGEISQDTMQRSLANAAYIIQNSRDQSVVWDETGLQATKLNDPLQITRLTSSGLIVSADGGQTWGVAISGYGINTNYLSAGTIDADKINILSGAYPTFKWDANGLRAYGFTKSGDSIISFDPSTFVCYDKYGIYGIKDALNPTFETLNDVENRASFALTWNGLFMRAQHRDGYVRISPTEDIVLYKTIEDNGSPTDILRGKFGVLDDDVYGIALYDAAGNATVTTQSNGTLWLQDSMRIGDESNQNGQPRIYLGRGEDAGENLWKVMRVYNTTDQDDRFVLFSDGTMHASGVSIEGIINATGGTIGGLSIDELVLSVGVSIEQLSGNIFNKDINNNITPESLKFKYKTSLESNKISSEDWYISKDNQTWTLLRHRTSNFNQELTVNYNVNYFEDTISYLKIELTGLDSKIYSDILNLKLTSDSDKYKIIIAENNIYKFPDSLESNEPVWTLSINEFDLQILNVQTNSYVPFIYTQVTIDQTTFDLDKIKYYYYDSEIQKYKRCNLNDIYDNSIQYYTCNINITTNTRYSTIDSDKYISPVIGNSNKVTYSIEDFYADRNLESEYTYFWRTVRGNEYIKFIITLYVDGAVYSLSDTVNITVGTTESMATFAVHANSINAAIGSTSLEFGSNGLTINNGGLTVNTNLNGYNRVTISEADFNNDKTSYYYYDSVLDRFIACTNASVYDTSIQYYKNFNNEEITVLDFDNDTGNLSIKGIIYADGGYFSGTIHARDGEFSGVLKSASGEIGGFIISENSLSTEGITLHSATDDIASYIEVEKIIIGRDAQIKEFLKLGNLTLWNPTQQAANNLVLQLSQDGNNYFTLDNDGNIRGLNWHIAENGNGDIEAEFDLLRVNDGYFKGQIEARDGYFEGLIIASVLNADTINTVHFNSERVRAMGGAFIFRPSIPIEFNEDDSPADNRYLRAIVTNNEYFYYFGYNTQTQSYEAVGEIVLLVGETIDANDIGKTSRYGKISGITKQTQEDDKTVLIVTIDMGNNTTQIPYENYSYYQNLILFGKPEEDVIIGINSDNQQATKFLPYHSLSMAEFSDLQGTVFSQTYLNPKYRLILGDLSVLGDNNNNISGYGLYADNVFLRGSLTTANVENNSVYAGINTQRHINFKYDTWSNAPLNNPDDEKIVFWGGASDMSNDSICKSPFIVTDKGNIYARSGEFKGTVITDSLITNTVIKAPVIYGNNKRNEVSLKIVDTTEPDNTTKFGGIGFYELVDEPDLYIVMDITETEFNANKTKYWYNSANVGDESDWTQSKSNDTYVPTRNYYVRNDKLTVLLTNKGFYHFHDTVNENTPKIGSDLWEQRYKFINFVNNSNKVEFLPHEVILGDTHLVDGIFSKQNASLAFYQNGDNIKLRFGDSALEVNNTGIIGQGSKQILQNEITFISTTTQTSKKLEYKINDNNYYCLYVTE